MLVNMFSAGNSMEHSRVLIIFGPSECRWEIKKMSYELLANHPHG